MNYLEIYVYVIILRLLINCFMILSWSTNVICNLSIMKHFQLNEHPHRCVLTASLAVTDLYAECGYTGNVKLYFTKCDREQIMLLSLYCNCIWNQTYTNATIMIIVFINNAATSKYNNSTRKLQILYHSLIDLLNILLDNRVAVVISASRSFNKIFNTSINEWYRICNFLVLLLYLYEQLGTLHILLETFQYLVITLRFG